MGALVFLTLLLWLPFAWNNRDRAISSPDAQDYAQIARNVAHGQGFVSSTEPLNGLEWQRQTGRLGQPWWDLHRFPLPSLIEAGFIHVFGDNDASPELFSALFFFATIPMLYAFARRLVPFPVALGTAALFALTRGQLATSISGLTEPAAIFFFVAALYFVVWPMGIWSLALAGVLTGLAYLNRSSTVLYAVPMLVWIWLSGGPRVRNLLTFVFPAAIVVLPWLVRNVLLTGDPMFSLTTALIAPYRSPVSPHTHDWFLFHYETAGHFWRHHPAATLDKWWLQTRGVTSRFPELGNLGFLFPFVLLGIIRPADGMLGRLYKWLAAVAILHWLTLGLLSNEPRYYAIFIPFVMLLAASGMAWTVELLRGETKPLLVVAALLLILPILSLDLQTVVGPPAVVGVDSAWFQVSPNNQRWLREHLPAGALVATDVPWTVAWYARHRAVPISPTPAEMARVADYGLQPDAIYLNPSGPGEDIPDGWSQWRALQRGHAAPPGFHLVRTFTDGGVYYERVGKWFGRQARGAI